MSRNPKTTIRDSLDLIESKLNEPLNVDGLAAVTFFSKAQFQHLFREIMGGPVMEYVKKRRLQRACAALLETDESVLDVALSLGYESHEGFTRAFKAYFGFPPSHFRKKMKNIIGGKVMLSGTLSKDIKRHMSKISERMLTAKNETDEIIASAGEAAGTAGPPRNGSILVLISEWKNIAVRFDAAAKTAGDFLKDSSTVYDLTDKVYAMLKNLDDTAFQMNLLCFFSNIETARMGGRENEIFTAVNKRFAKLTDTVVCNKKDAAAVLESLAAMVREEIKDEAEAQIKSILVLLTAAADGGGELANKARMTADAWDSCGRRGGVIKRLADEVETQTENVRKIQKIIRRDCQRSNVLRGLEGAAFRMNIAGFNASVEAARSGPEGGEHDMGAYALARGIHQYADLLNQAYSKCAVLYDEYEKLSGLLVKTPETAPDDSNTDKNVSDSVLRCEIIGMQLGIEADRIGSDTFKSLAAKVLTAAGALAGGGRNHLPEFHAAISSAQSECKREAEACGSKGAAFAYIAKELGYLGEKIDAML